MNFYDVFVRSPVNRQAAQSLDCAGSENKMGREDIIYLMSRTVRKRRLLEKKLGIKTLAQRKNLRSKVAKGRPTVRGAYNPRAVDEWIRTGVAIEALKSELRRIKEAA